MPRSNPGDPVLATNKKAFHDYQVLERFEAGISLSGTEVKSCRARSIAMNEAYVQIVKGEAWLVNMHIAPYGFGNRFNHDVRARRRLLLHKKELLKLANWLGSKGGTLIPIKVYLKCGLIKVEIAYCQGKNHGDKRDSLRQKQEDRELSRLAKLK